MNVLAMMMPVYDAGIVALAVAAGVDLARRGGAGPWALALGPAAVAQLVAGGARMTLPMTHTLGWVWLAQSAANAALIYALWQAGNLALSCRAAQAEAEPERPLDLPMIRAVASWPGRRR